MNTLFLLIVFTASWDIVHYTFDSTLNSSANNTSPTSYLPTLTFKNKYTLTHQYLACNNCFLFFTNAAIYSFTPTFTAYATLFNANSARGTWFWFSSNMLFDIRYTDTSVSLTSLSIYYPSNSSYATLPNIANIFGNGVGLPANQ